MPAFAGEGCTWKKAIQAEQTIVTLSTWPEVYDSFKQYGACDDGGISEGYDDRIADLLTKKWGSINELKKLVEADPKFKKFVFVHVDILMSRDDAKKIIENSEKHCPDDAKKLCAELTNKAQNPG